MSYSAKVHSIGWRQTWTPAALGDLPIPDPRAWPAGVRARYHELTGDCGPLDVFIFISGATAAMYLQDAVTALGILDVDPSMWHTEDGYPAFHFDPERVQEYCRRLSACGYAVRIIEPEGRAERPTGRAAGAAVVDIASARRRRSAL